MGRKTLDKELEIEIAEDENDLPSTPKNTFTIEKGLEGVQKSYLNEMRKNSQFSLYNQKHAEGDISALTKIDLIETKEPNLLS